MDNRPDLSFYFAIHQAQHATVDRYRQAVATLAEHERTDRGKALTRWAKGFALELEEHHSTEDSFFFPSLPIEGPVRNRHHRRPRRRPPQPRRTHRPLADDRPSARRSHRALRRRPSRPGGLAALHDLLHRHLAVEDRDILPLFWRHYTAADYDQVFRRAVKNSKKAGMSFIAPFTVDCYTPGAERDAFLASVPGILRLIHRVVRPAYDRLAAAAFGRPAQPRSPPRRNDRGRRAAKACRPPLVVSPA